MTSSEDWTWKFTPRAADQFDGLDPHVQDRLVSKLDEVVDSAWREPDDFLEPLTGGPFPNFASGSIGSPVRSITVTRYSKSIGSNTGAGHIPPMTTDERCESVALDQRSPFKPSV